MVFAPTHDLIVIGGTRAGLSLAHEAQLAGVGRVLVLEAGDHVLDLSFIDANELDVHFETPVTGISVDADRVTIETPDLRYRAGVCVVAQGVGSAPTGISMPGRRVHSAVGAWVEAGEDVLLVGAGERLLGAAEQVVAAGGRAKLCVSSRGYGALSRRSAERMHALERSRAVVLVPGNDPVKITERADDVVVRFADDSTPALTFDHVVYAVGGAADAALLRKIESRVPEGMTPRMLVLADATDVVVDPPSGVAGLDVATAWHAIAAAHFGGPAEPTGPTQPSTDAMEELRWQRYNATVRDVVRVSDDSWRVRIAPDAPSGRRFTGSAAVVGVGWWEPRHDDIDDADLVTGVDRLVRVAYPTGAPVFDDRDYLVDQAEDHELMFWVSTATDDAYRNALAARLAFMKDGDRVFVGPRLRTNAAAGRGADDAGAEVMLVSTVEASPACDSMVVDLLRRGHHGRITSIVVGSEGELGEVPDDLRRLVARFPSYRRIEQAGPVEAWSDLIGGALAEPIDPDTHVFLRGFTPAMTAALEDRWFIRSAPADPLASDAA